MLAYKSMKVNIFKIYKIHRYTLTESANPCATATLKGGVVFRFLKRFFKWLSSNRILRLGATFFKNISRKNISFHCRPPKNAIVFLHKLPAVANNTKAEKSIREIEYMKATGIVRRIDDLGRVVIPKEIRRTMRIREGDPLHTSLTPYEKFCYAMLQFAERCIGK